MKRYLRILILSLVLVLVVLVGVVVLLLRQPDEAALSELETLELPDAAWSYYAQYLAPLETLLRADAAEQVLTRAEQDLVLATVDGWPVWLSELAWACRLGQIEDALLDGVLNEVMTPYQFELLLERQLALWQAEELGLWPTAEQVEQEILLLQVQGGAYPLWLADQLGVTLDEYWQVCAPYEVFHNLIMRGSGFRFGMGGGSAFQPQEDPYYETLRDWKRQMEFQQYDETLLGAYTPLYDTVLQEISADDAVALFAQ